MDKKRVAGILFPIFSLPSDECIGTLGRFTYRFVNHIYRSGMSVWQILPLTPTGYGNSPYQSCSATALNYYMIDLKELVDEGLLKNSEFRKSGLRVQGRRVDYGKLFSVKIPLLRKAFGRFDVEDEDFVAFLDKGEYADFAAYMTLKENFDYRPWNEWPKPYRTYDESVIGEYTSLHRREFLFWQFTQYIFLKQWNALKEYANNLGIKIMGDIPLYLSYDSVEMWKEGDKLFLVDKKKRPTLVAGAPPDAFNADGQLWGNPLYNRKKMKADGYKWWNERLKYNLKLYDIIRLDHFRGFDRFYAVPYGAASAREGKWLNGPAEELFADKLDWNIVAEDLCVYDEGVVRLMKNTGYPGMKMLGEAFDGNPANGHKPSNFDENCVCYTGTHDSMTLMQSYNNLSAEQAALFNEELTKECEDWHVMYNTETPRAVCRTIIRLALCSRAFAVIIPLWDWLLLGAEARINAPGMQSDDNWSYRITSKEISVGIPCERRELIRRTGRLSADKYERLLKKK